MDFGFGFEFGLLPRDPKRRLRGLLDRLGLEVLGNNHLNVLVDRINAASETPCPAHHRVRQAIGERRRTGRAAVGPAVRRAGEEQRE